MKAHEEIALILVRDIIRHLDMRHVGCGGEIASIFQRGGYCTGCQRLISTGQVVVERLKDVPSYVQTAS